MGLGDAAELGLPAAVEDDPVDVATTGVGPVAVGLGGGEVDVRRRAYRVVRVEHGLDRLLAHQRSRNARGDAFAGHVVQRLVPELGRIGVALADQAVVQPLPGDAFELAEQI